ncbi:MAG: helix-turn-helix transcriptional regulator [Parvularculales bacterium]
MSNEISRRLAKCLRDARKERSLSLEALSKLSGVSRSMLSAIERNESSPTVATLWNLTKSLNLDFAGLLDSTSASDGPIVEVIRSAQAPVIQALGHKCSIRILSAPESVGETEIYELNFEEGGVLESKPHRHGCLENLTVITGTITIITDGVTEVARVGDMVRYFADRPHSLSSPDEKSCAILIVTGS